MERLKRLRDDFDWSSIRFSGEATLRREVESLPGIGNFIGELGADWPRGGGMRVTRSLSPALWESIEFLRAALRLKESVQLELSGQERSCCEAWKETGSESIVVRVGGAYVAGLASPSSLFWLGRQIGRVVLEQLPLSDVVAGRTGGDRETSLLRGLYRFQEMTCDRAGLLACQDILAASRWMVCTFSGLAESMVSESLDALVGELEDEEDAMISPTDYAFLLLRLSALRKFSESARYGELFVEEDLAMPAVWRRREVVEPRVRTVEIDASKAESPDVRDTADSRSPSTEEDDSMCIEYRPIGGDPSVVERVLRIAPREAVEKDAPTEPAVGGLAQQRAFRVAAAFWLVGLKPSIGDRQRRVLMDMYGETVLDEVRPLYETHGEAVFAERCRADAKRIQGLERSTRVEILRELCRVTMVDESDPGPFRAALAEIADLLDLTGDDLSMALADYVDPEFSTYEFQSGETVDVHLDGQWVEGVVERVEPGGELRIRFASSGKQLRLHPMADVIRPRGQRRVG